MFNLGEYQTLIVDHFADAGAFLRESAGDETVLLPGRQVPEGTDVGSLLTVFLYKDSEDRLIATTGTPLLVRGGIALLSVKQTSPIGAFLDVRQGERRFAEQLPPCVLRLLLHDSDCALRVGVRIRVPAHIP